MSDTDLDRAVREANARLAAMTPDEQASHWAAQRESWVRGEMAMGSDAEEAHARATRRLSNLVAKSQALVDAISSDDNGSIIAGQYKGGNGGLLSHETIKAADDLRLELANWAAVRKP